MIQPTTATEGYDTMNLREMKAAAPALFNDTYYSACPDYQQLAGNLKAAGMMAPAWAVEDMASTIAELEEDIDSRLSPEQVAEMDTTLARCVDVFEALDKRLKARDAELNAALERIEGDEALNGLWLALDDIRYSLNKDREALAEVAEQVAEVRALLED